jgi:hypothetical protein
MPTPTLDLAPVRAAIKAKIAGVASMGQVHDYERYAKDQSALKNLYKSAAQTGERIYGWFVSRRATREWFVDTGRWVADVDWKMHGLMSLDDADASEKKLDVQVELIRDAFRHDDTLGGAVATLCVANGNEPGLSGVQVDEIGPVLFAGVLCHRARLALTTRIYL